MATKAEQKLFLFALPAPKLRSMESAGAPTLPRTFSIATAPFGVIIPRRIAGSCRDWPPSQRSMP
ncbi:hypothetical protein GGE07_002909 [Sinorhizobium terangae]|nr:hypothetical protein [Sinorhizobium terangae]